MNRNTWKRVTNGVVVFVTVTVTALGAPSIARASDGSAMANSNPNSNPNPNSSASANINPDANPNRNTRSSIPKADEQPNDLDHVTSAGSKVFYRNKVVVVTYHDVSPNVYSAYVLTPQAFSAQLDAFQKANLHVITNAEFIRFINGQGSVPPNAVLLTFDDGYRSMYTYALPILMQHHMQGTFFVVVGTADKQDQKTLSWPQIRTMAQDGMAFGSHTYDAHSLVTRLGRLTPVFNTHIVVNGHLETPRQYFTRVYTDFMKSRARLSQVLGVDVVEFAWPYGHGNPASNRIARRAGYEYLFTTSPGHVTAESNPFFIHRIDVGKTEVGPQDAVQRIIDTGRFMPWLYHME